MDRQSLTPEAVREEHRAGIRFKQGIGLYECVETNENFFIGKQWEGVQAGGLPTPVFNFLKRVVLFAVANVSTDNWKLQATPLPAFPPVGGQDRKRLEQLTHALNDQFAALFEFNKLGSLLREVARNAAVDGDGCTYTYWDSDAETGQAARGAIRTEVLQNTQVHFGNPNSRDLQGQPYLLIERRMLVEDARRRADLYGGDGSAISADDREGGNREMDRLGGEKVTVLLRLWKEEETGTIWGYECTKDTEIRAPWDLGIRRYPITWMNWDYVTDCFHGQAMITGLIPNQIFVNKLFAMSMISLMTLAYPKVLYDRTRIAGWSNRVGAAIGVSGPVEDAVRTIGPAAVSPQIGQFIELAVGYTQKFLGASDAALGDARPDNASAILALQRAASTPMELSRQNLLQTIEDLGRIYMEFMGSCYGVRAVLLPDMDRPVTLDFSVLREIPFSMKLEAGASSYWSEIAAMQTLDNLLVRGRISTVEYLKRLPAGQITDRDALIQALEMEQQKGAMYNDGTAQIQ